MINLYKIGGLPFWTEEEILRREQFIETLNLTMKIALKSINKAFEMHRIEGSLMMPFDHVNAAYDDGDVFINQKFAMRPETTNGSYLYARHLLNNGHKKPICVWQAGKSFRVESNDGATASKLRFNEFYQIEFQCIYSNESKADYMTHVSNYVKEIISELTFSETRIVDSDRLPSYSKKTIDVECIYNGDWKEMCSISLRTDFSDTDTVLEVAIGLDRLVMANMKNRLLKLEG